jgi:hypothetical protein
VPSYGIMRNFYVNSGELEGDVNFYKIIYPAVCVPWPLNRTFSWFIDSSYVD